MKHCPVCRQSVIGRSDKKYCSDDCRAEFHNKKNVQLFKLVRKTNKILIKNRNILIDLFEKDLLEVSINLLLDKQFNFSYCTKSSEGLFDNKYVFCYDMLYQKQRNGLYRIHKVEMENEINQDKIDSKFNGR